MILGSGLTEDMSPQKESSDDLGEKQQQDQSWEQKKHIQKNLRHNKSEWNNRKGRPGFRPGKFKKFRNS